MYPFIVPDYKKRSIVNLMSSISHNFGQKHTYRELDILNSKELKKFKNIVLLVIDGLGYNYLKNKKDSFLFNHLKSNLSSTFLATTACANTVFSVGYPPQQHGLTGWTINLKEIGAITTIIPFTPTFGKEHLTKSNFNIDQVLDIKSFHKELNCNCFTLLDKKIANSEFNNYLSRSTKIIPFQNYTKMFTELKKILATKSTKRRFIHGYVDELDSIAHKKGINSKETTEIFNDLDKQVNNLIKNIQNTNTKLIIVADHGFIDTAPNKEIFTEKIPGFKECLTIPLTGEPRVRNCFIRPNKVKDFEKIVKTKMKKYCWLYRGEKIIKDNLYGLGKPNKKLIDRVGDYVLIMKENYILRDNLANYKKYKEFNEGKHGGVSGDEMMVPLITFDC